MASLLFQDPITADNELSQNDIGFSNLLGLMSNDMAKTLHIHRTNLYDKLSEFFPDSLTQPRWNLVDLLPL